MKTFALAAALVAFVVRVDAAPTSPIQGLRVLPPALTLEDARDARKVVVEGRTSDGYWLDLTDRSVIKPTAPIVSRDSDGFYHPAKVGTAALAISVGSRHASIPITVRSVTAKPVSFVREVMPILARTGCNAGTCHGAAK